MNDKILTLIEQLGDQAFLAFVLYLVFDYGTLILLIGGIFYGVRCVWPTVKRYLEDG